MSLTYRYQSYSPHSLTLIAASKFWKHILSSKGHKSCTHATLGSQLSEHCPVNNDSQENCFLCTGDSTTGSASPLVAGRGLTAMLLNSMIILSGHASNRSY